MDELRRLAIRLRGVDVEGFEVILDTIRLLGLGYLYQPEWSVITGASLPFTVELQINPTHPMFIELSIVAFDAGSTDNLLMESFAGGTVTPGVAVVRRPLNTFTPNIDPLQRATEGATVLVAGTPIAREAGNLRLASNAIVPPNAQFYLTFSQLGAGQPPTDIQLTTRIASIEPYPTA